MIGIDEEGTLAQLKALRRTLFDPKITEHHGSIVLLRQAQSGVGRVDVVLT